MDLDHFTREARILMNAHDLHHIPVTLDRARKRMGACHYRTTTVSGKKVYTTLKLSFSSHYVSLLGWDELEDIVLHEIAHAHAPGDDHGFEFMRKCREVGAVPARCKAVTASPEATVTAFCPECGEQNAGQFRLPTRLYVCSKCRVGGDKVILVWYRKGHRVALESMPRDYQARVNWYNRRKS